MKYALSILLLLSISVSIYANEPESEFKYIQPIAVEEVSIKKVVVPKPLPKIQPKPKPQPKIVEKIIVVPEPKKLDDDNDGVFNKNDSCPNTNEGIMVDSKGCELDSDEDGVVDSNDVCPGTSKEFNVDGYGCPQTATLKLYFPTASYKITDRLISELEAFAQFLQNNTGYDVIISGHTDNVGTHKDNMLLSQNRANSVKEALTRYGINAFKLITIGKSFDEPIANNETKEGRSLNRRIEV